MANRRFVVLIAAVALVAGLVPALLQRRSPPAPGPASHEAVRAAVEPVSDALAGEAAVPSTCKVGFIDLETVFNQCRQTKAYGRELEAMREGVEKQIRPLLEEVRGLEEKCNVLAPQAPERAALEAQIREKRKAGAKIEEPLEQDLLKKNLVMKEKVYTLIRAATQRVARSRGIDLVLGDVEEPHPDFTGTSSQEFDRALREYMIKMQRKAVLYASKDVDLTSAVLEAVNAEP